MQPTQKFLVQHHFSCIPITQLQCFFRFHMMTLLYSMMFQRTRWNKTEKNPCHMKCSSLFMRCDAKTWYSYVLFKITWYSHDSHQPNIHPFHPPAPGERLHLRGATSNGSAAHPKQRATDPRCPGTSSGAAVNPAFGTPAGADSPGNDNYVSLSYPPKKRKSPLPILIEHEKAGHTTSKKMHSLIHLHSSSFICHWSNIES